MENSEVIQCNPRNSLLQVRCKDRARGWVVFQGESWKFYCREQTGGLKRVMRLLCSDLHIGNTSSCCVLEKHHPEHSLPQSQDQSCEIVTEYRGSFSSQPWACRLVPKSRIRIFVSCCCWNTLCTWGALLSGGKAAEKILVQIWGFHKVSKQGK